MNSQPRTAAGHFHAPTEDGAYSTGPLRAGLPADLKNPLHYPVKAVCRCGEVIRCESPQQAGWTGTGRRAGDSL